MDDPSAPPAVDAYRPGTPSPLARLNPEAGRRFLELRLRSDASLAARGDAFVRDGHLVQRVASDRYHGGEAELVVHTQRGRAHVVCNGFLTTYHAEAPGLGGKKWRELLGPPLDDEKPDGLGRAVQHFEHGTTYWSPAQGIQVALKPGAPVGGATNPDFLKTLVDVRSLGDGFKSWLPAQARSNRHIGATYRAIEDLLAAPDAPGSIGGLLEKTRAAALRSLATDPTLPGQDREAAANLITLVALAAHAIQNHHAENAATTLRFPPYLPDGRPGEVACDRAWHFVNHAMMAHLFLFLKKQGLDEGVQAIRDLVLKADPDAKGEVARAIYDEVKGRVGSVLAGTLPGPPDSIGFYAPPPPLLNAAEREAYELTTRIGFAYEINYLSPHSDDAPLLGNLKDADPFAEVNATFTATSGMGDPNWVGDCTANNLGAQMGIALARSPRRIPEVPQDVGFATDLVTYGPRPIDGHAFLDAERAMLERASGLSFPSSSGEPLPAATDAYLRAMHEATQAIAERDPELLPRFYANFAVRFLRWSGRLPDLWDQSPRFADHLGWAKGQTVESVQKAIHDRVRGAQAFFA